MKTLSNAGKKLKKAIMKQFVFEDDVSLAILETGLQAWDLMHHAMDVVALEGLTVQGDRGGVKAHPLLQVVRDQRSQFLAAFKALNLALGEEDQKTKRGPGRKTNTELWMERARRRNCG